MIAAVIIISLFIGVVTAGLAAHKGRNPYVWGLLGAGLGLIGLLVTALQSPLPDSNAMIRAKAAA